MWNKYTIVSGAGVALALAFTLPESAGADETTGPGRDRWQMPNEVLAALDLKKGDVVADIGAGVGYFTLRFAQAVGPKGKVYAVDIDAHVLEYLKKEARKQNASNVETLLSHKDDPLLPAGSVNVAFFCDTVHQISDRVDFYRKVKHALKRNGTMAIIDWLPPPRQPGTPSHDSESQVSPESTIREAEAAGFQLLKEPKFLSKQFFLIFKKADRT
jgi:predicted methyltransferase